MQTFKSVRPVLKFAIPSKLFGTKTPIEDNEADFSLPNVLTDEITEEMGNDEIDQEFIDITNEIKKTFKIKEEIGSGKSEESSSTFYFSNAHTPFYFRTLILSTTGKVTLNTTYENEKIEVIFDCQDEAGDLESFDLDDNEVLLSISSNT